MQSNPLGISITKADGFVDYKDDSLARDPSLIVAYPYPPSGCVFYVDDTLQIQAGEKILYSTEAENNPVWLTEASALLFRLRLERSRLLPSSPQAAALQADIDSVAQRVVDYHQGRKRVKAERVVAYVDPARKLIAVTEPFTHGYKPRVMGTVVRILGFVEDAVDEKTTDELHKKANKLYGSYDWESEWKATGHFPKI